MSETTLNTAYQTATSLFSHHSITGTQPTSFLKDINTGLLHHSNNASPQTIIGSSATLLNLLTSDTLIDSCYKHENINTFLALSSPASPSIFHDATDNINSIIDRYTTFQPAIPPTHRKKNTQVISSIFPSLNLATSHLPNLSHINLDISDTDIYAPLHVTHLPTYNIEKKRKVINRANNIVLLLNEICVTNPIRIDKSRITTSIETINLSWIFAICQAKYNEFKEIELRSLTLQAGMNYIQKRIIDSLRQSGNLSRLQQHSSHEVDMVFADITTVVSYYVLPLELIQKLLTNDPAFSELCLQKRALNLPSTSTKKEPETNSAQLKIRNTSAKTRKTYNPETSLARASEMRHKNNHAMKDEAIRLYRSNKYKSKASAAKEIFPLLSKFCEDKKIKMLTTTNGEQTICKWLRAVK